MTSPETVDAQMRPPSPVLPNDLDERVKDAIDRERLDGAYFQDPYHLERGESTRLLNIISTIIQAPVPSDISVQEVAEALSVYVTGRFESWVKKCWNMHPEDLNQQARVASGSGGSLRNGFHSKYRGNHPQAFIEQLREYRSQYVTHDITQTPYSWSISVVQSSGMGKSRMIREVSRLVFMIPINVRETLPPNIAAYPPPDHNVREYFLALGPRTDIEVQVCCTIFLIELFKHVRELVRQQKHSSGSELALEWAEYLEDGESTKGVGENRLRLYEEVISRSYKRIARLSMPMTLKRLAPELSCECQALKAAIGPASADSFYVAFDDAHTLTVPRIHDPTETKDAEREHSIYSNLEKVLTYLIDTPPFFVFLSTNLHLQPHRPAPLTRACSSAWHIKEDGHILLPPWTLLPFNVFAQETIWEHGPLTLDNISKVRFMAGFGRALWRVHCDEEVALDRHEDGNHLFTMASRKLAPSGAEWSEICLAAIGVRVGFSFDPRITLARELESKMVEKYMRVAIQVPPHREYMVTAALREPVLAEVAGRVCVLSEHGASTLDQYFGRGVLACGERGEVVGRLLLTLAHDEALSSHGFGPSNQSLNEPMYHRPVALLDFLLALFHKDYHDTILGAQPTGDPNGASLRKTFENAYIHFSHFGVAADEATLDVELMFQCLVTGTALQACMNRGSVDAVIPVHLGSTSSPISKATTSSINLQFKNRDEPKPSYVERTIVIPDKGVPTISLTMELGTEPEKSGVVVTGVGRTHSKPPPSSSWDDKHYEMVAYGHGANIYNVISKEMQPTYARLLAPIQSADNHPYPENERMLELFRSIDPETSPSNLFRPRSDQPARV